MHRAIEQSGKPWVAAINGLALGGGFELALACHHRILVDDPKAQVGLPEVNVGLLPGSGGTVRLGIIAGIDRKSTRLELQSLMRISYAVFCLKKKKRIKRKFLHYYNTHI